VAGDTFSLRLPISEPQFLERFAMSFVTVSHWTSTEEITDVMIATVNEKFIPMIMAAGASAVQMVRTGDLTSCVVTHYADAATAQAAQARITELRGQVASDFPMTMDSAQSGEVIGSA
jgi:hypothetical protein